MHRNSPIMIMLLIIIVLWYMVPCIPNLPNTITYVSILHCVIHNMLSSAYCLVDRQLAVTTYVRLLKSQV